MKNTHIKQSALLVSALFVGSTCALAADLDLSAESGGANFVAVLPGATVNYQIVGELSDAQTQGLAMFTFDLSFSGGPLTQADEPAGGSTMDTFSRPEGMTIPAGYGGMLSGGDLLQVGGAQNTINNSFAPIPIGAVTTGIAMEGSPEVLVTGSLVAPVAPGVYTLEIVDPMANVIRLGATGVPFWNVSAADDGTATPLTIQVVDCTAPMNYCTGKLNSQGCVPSMGSTGTASLTGADDFRLTVSDLINNQNGIVFWGLGSANVPFMGGLRCVANPVVRLAVMGSGGSAPPTMDCSGTFDFAFTQSYMLTQGLVGGTEVYAQCWYRDPMIADGTSVGLSDGISFVICP